MKRFFVQAVFAPILLAALAACGKESKFVYYEEQRDLKVSMEVRVKEVVGATGVDLLWVIDNSGSMDFAQRDVIANAGRFMQEFTKGSLEWKLGLISTDTADDPFLGMMPGDDFDFRDLDPTARFQKAVGDLGTSGAGTEKTLEPLLYKVADHPSFLRPGVPLAIVIVTDAEEQSEVDFPTWLKEFHTVIGEKRPYYVYGVLNATDMGCKGEADTGTENWNFTGSPYEALQKTAKSGKMYAMCKTDYGKALAEMGRDISQQVSRPLIYLKDRPKPSTIRVFYRGLPLSPGPREAGGMWYYDYGNNAVSFYSLEFAELVTDFVTVSYDKDDGLPAGE